MPLVSLTSALVTVTSVVPSLPVKFEPTAVKPLVTLKSFSFSVFEFISLRLIEIV